MTPKVATIVYGRSHTNAPSSERNSPMNPENPGSPMPAKSAVRNRPPSTGVTFHTPRNAEISRV